MQKYKKSIPSRLTETWDNLPLRGKYFFINSGSQTSLQFKEVTLKCKNEKSIPGRLIETWDNLPLRGKYFSINSGSQTS